MMAAYVFISYKYNLLIKFNQLNSILLSSIKGKILKINGKNCFITQKIGVRLK